MASINKDSLDLEVKHKSDGSWHPCRVSLRSVNAKMGIVVNFEKSKEEDIIYGKKEALTRLRFRSTPLQNGECSLIKEGDSVLALYKDQSKSIYFDAVIEKPHRVKHSNRASCRCNFEIKRQNSELRGETVKIPSKSILKISDEEIVSNTIFKSFLSAMDSSDAAKSPSSLFSADDANVEVDIDGMLDKQIEQISESVNSDAKRFKDKKAMSSSKSTRRSSRSQNKQQSDAKGKNVPEEDKTFLSPLAARAALASLVHEQELPVEERFLSTPKEKIGDNETVEKSASDDKKVKTPVRASRSSNKEMKSPPSRGKNVSQDSASRTTRSSTSKEVDVEEDKILSSPVSASATPGRATCSSANKDEEKSGSSRGKIASPENTRKSRFSTSKESPSAEKLASPTSGKNSEGSKSKATRSSVTNASSDEALESSAGEKVTSPSARLIRSRNKDLPTDSEDTTPNKKMRAVASPTGTSEKSGGKMEENEEAGSNKKRKSVGRKEISSPKPQLRASPRLKPSPKT